jgi:glucokinase
LETYASAEGIRRTVKELLAENQESSLLQDLPFEEITAKKIADVAAKGDKLALKAFKITGEILGRSMAEAVAYLSPEAIVFFGGLAQAGELLFAPLQAAFDEALMSVFKGKVKLLKSGLNAGEAAILGAGALVWHELVKNEKDLITS